MKKLKELLNWRAAKILAVIILLGAVVTSYGVKCDLGTTNTTDGSSVSTPGKKGIAVDPYIVGAKFYEDKDDDGVYESLSENLSSATDNNGAFTFLTKLQLNSVVRFYEAITATHIGVPFNEELKRKVDVIVDTLVVSPLTTLLANGWSESQVLNALASAGLTGLTAADLYKNPMDIANSTGAGLTNADLAKIRATVSVYALLSLMDEINSNGYSLTYTGFTETPNAVALFGKIVTYTNLALSTTTITQLNTLITVLSSAVSTSGFAFPTPIASDVINTAVALINYAVPKWAADPNYSPSPSEFAAWTVDLLKGFYALRNRGDFAVGAAIIGGLLPQIGQPSTGVKTFLINALGNVVGQN